MMQLSKESTRSSFGVDIYRIDKNLKPGLLRVKEVGFARYRVRTTSTSVHAPLPLSSNYCFCLDQKARWLAVRNNWFCQIILVMLQSQCLIQLLTKQSFLIFFLCPYTSVCGDLTKSLLLSSINSIKMLIIFRSRRAHNYY